jgi:hypothetical protein
VRSAPSRSRRLGGLLVDGAESVFEHPRRGLVALRLAERPRVELRPDRGRVSGHLRRLDQVDAAASGERADGLPERLRREVCPSPALVAAFATRRCATLRGDTTVDRAGSGRRVCRRRRDPRARDQLVFRAKREQPAVAQVPDPRSVLWRQSLARHVIAGRAFPVLPDGLRDRRRRKTSRARSGAPALRAQAEARARRPARAIRLRRRPSQGVSLFRLAPTAASTRPRRA